MAFPSLKHSSVKKYHTTKSYKSRKENAVAISKLIAEYSYIRW